MANQMMKQTLSQGMRDMKLQMTPASAKQRDYISPGEDELAFIEINAAGNEDQQHLQVEQVLITEENVGTINVSPNDIDGLDADEFNLRANQQYKEMVAGFIGQTMDIN